LAGTAGDRTFLDYHGNAGINWIGNIEDTLIMMSAKRQFEKVSTLVVGMGITGISCARFLHKQGIPFRAVDSRPQPPQLAAFEREFSGHEIITGGFEQHALRGIETLLLSPGLSLNHPFIELARQQGVRIVGDIELFAAHANAPVIGITGSNGKSTVTTLVGYLLERCGRRVSVGGNLGTPALDLLSDPPPDFYVLELSSFQLDLTDSLRPAAAVVLNVSDDHMDRYADMAAYTASKARIYRQAHCCVVNRDDARVLAMPTGRTVRYFSTNAPAAGEYGLLEADGQTWLAYGTRKLIAVNRLAIEGRHNWSNALATLALLQAVGIEPEVAVEHLAGFKGLPHRCQLVAEHNGIRWVNDSKATNVGAAQAAIESFRTPIVLIAGGDGKGADFSVLRDTLAQHVKAVMLLGRDASLLEQTWSDVTRCVRVADMQAAVTQAADIALAGDTVLLAPACASLDMYSSYAARGDDFANRVQQVIRHG
jgi:UDP-N-acetylmuramoylalanine--D-glutamate ligase